MFSCHFHLLQDQPLKLSDNSSLSKLLNCLKNELGIGFFNNSFLTILIFSVHFLRFSNYLWKPLASILYHKLSVFRYYSKNYQVENFYLFLWWCSSTLRIIQLLALNHHGFAKNCFENNFAFKKYTLNFHFISNLKILRTKIIFSCYLVD